MQSMTQAELKAGMKQNGVLSHSDGYYKETESLSINMKNLQHFNHLGKETDNLVLLRREGDRFWTSPELENSKVVNHVVKDTENGGRDSPNEKNLGEVLYDQLGTKGTKTLTSEEENMDKLLNGPGLAQIMAPNDCTSCDEHELPQVITSKLVQADSTLYTDKSVMECEVPQLSVCCKDIDCQHVKDICVDKGEPLEEKGLIDKHTTKFMGPHVSKPSNGYETNDTAAGNLDYEFHIPDGLTSPAQADFSDLTVDSCEAKKQRKFISPVLSESECQPSVMIKENCQNSEAFMQASEKDVVTAMLPLEEFGRRSFLRSFMEVLNSQEEEVAQQPNQSMKENPRNPERGFEPEELNQNDADSITLDSCCEHTETDSRDVGGEVSEKPWKAEDVLNDPSHSYRHLTDPLAAHAVQCADMDEREEENSPDNEFTNLNNPFLVSEIQNSGQDGSTIDTHHETLLKNMERHPSNPFSVEIHSDIVGVSTEEILPTTKADHKENFNPFAFSENETPSIVKDTENIYQEPAESPKRRSTNNPFADCEVENNKMNKNCGSIGQQPELSKKIANTNNPFSMSNIHSSSEAKGIQHGDEQPELNHKENNYNPFTDPEIDKIVGNTEGALKNVYLTDLGGAGVGETSFSAVSGRITYSGTIPFSGSTSLRSDSSTTSTRSFAFPVLQSEWNSSPVRMERTDRQQFRKQRGGWKHGILCCKF